MSQQYNSRETAEVADFTASLRQQSVSKDGVFDSAAADDFMANAINQSTGVKVPEKLQATLDESDQKGANGITRAILDGVNAYEKAHGVDCPADVQQQAMHLAYATSGEARRSMGIFDSATSHAHDAQSLQPNRAVIAILATMTEAIPFAHYLPADISSNEAKLAIMTHQAGNDYGSYAQGDIMDGGASGDAYITSGREHLCKIEEDAGDPNGNITGKITAVQDTSETCDPDGANVKLLRGRSLVYLDGMIVGKEVSATGTGPSNISGQARVGSKVHQIGGTINPDTGDIALTATPALPKSAKVLVEAFVDYERAPDLTPEIITAVETFELYAKPWRVTTQQTIDSRTQMANELGLDPYSEGVLGIQSQFANERHYEVLRKARRLAGRNQEEFDFAWATQGDYKSRSDVWRDFNAVVGAVSQRMALTTMNHGVTHLYVGENVAAQMQGLPMDIWEPSGVVERPGIFRLGRLFGRYDVYYSPKVVLETEGSAEVLCVGRATDVTRNPFVLGDAVPPTVVPLATNSDLKSGAGFYARNFTSVNPHQPSSTGCALINVTNLF